MRLKIVLVACFLVFGGCTDPGLTFHVVDDKGQPLAGVTADEQGAKHDLVFGSFSHTVYPPTDKTGVLTTGRMRRGWGYHWHFTKAGYKASHVLFSAEGSFVFAPLKPPQYHVEPVGQHVPNHPFIVVPIYPELAPSAVPGE